MGYDFFVHNGLMIQANTNMALDYDIIDKDQRKWEYQWYFSLNEKSFQGDSFEFGKQKIKIQKEKPRVLCVGDSGTFGSGITLEESFCYQLGIKYPKLEFINVAVPSMSTVDELSTLVKLLPLKPDHVILGYFIPNDINLSYMETLWIKDDSKSWLNTHSSIRLLNLIKFSLTAKKRLQVSKQQKGGKLIVDKSKAIDETGLNFSKFVEGEMALYRPLTPTLRKAFYVFESLMLKFKNLSEENDFTFQVALIPTRSMIYDKYIHLPDNHEGLQYFKNRGFQITNDQLDFRQPERILLNSCKKVGITCRSLMLKINAKNKDWILLQGDDHMTRTGHKLTSELFQFPTL